MGRTGLKSAARTRCARVGLRKPHMIARHTNRMRSKAIHVKVRGLCQILPIVCAGFFVAFINVCAAQSAPADVKRAAWSEDFRQLINEMSSHYANLEWAVEERRMNLPALRQETEEKLRLATNGDEAKGLLGRFVNSFGDGHLEIRSTKPAARAPNSDATTPLGKQTLCEAIGYRTPSKISGGLDFSLLTGFVPFSDPDAAEFTSGILDLGSGGKVGIIRIPLFDPRAHPNPCHAAIQELGIPETKECDGQCRNRIERAAGNLLGEVIARLANAFTESGARGILVDITHNGGGSDWVELPPRILSPVALQEPRSAFIKHQHWIPQLESRLQDIETNLKAGAEPRSVLEEAKGRLIKALAETKQSCDRSGVWVTGRFTCSHLVKDVLYTAGMLPYAKPGSFAGLESRISLFHPLRWSYIEGRNRLPLFVAVDRETWSAAEYFAAILQDNKAATLVGELTGGAGCGYTNGGISTVLTNSKARVLMPDCVRLRRDGSNEVNGITPDILVPWADRDTPFAKVNKLAFILKTFLDRRFK